MLQSYIECKRIVNITAIILTCLTQAVCTSAQANDLGHPIIVGDSISITVYREEELSGVFVVDANGFINYPLLREIEAKGKTLSALQTIIQDGLERDFLVDPQVTVERKEEIITSIAILGQVNSPGNYDYSNSRSLVRLISEAGGLTRYAAHSATITRPSSEGEKNSVLSVNISSMMQGREKDMKLEPGDIVFIPESLF